MRILSWACLLVATVAVAADVPTLRQATNDRMLIGCAIMLSDLQDPPHAKLISTQFNCLTPGNEMKPDYLQKVKGRFTFDTADKIVAFAQSHDMKVIGHTLCWHQQSPAWLFADENKNPLPREQALENLRVHINTVVNHFKGKVKGWDVVNEAIGDSEPYLRDTPARRAIGDDFVIKAFQFARQADPDGELYYNDYNIEARYKREKALRLLRELKSAGVWVDGVGIQGHWLLDSPDLAEIEEGIKAFADEGCKIMITELDVNVLPRAGAGADISATQKQGMDPYQAGLPDAVQQKLAQRYRDLFTVIKKYPQITRVTLWGTHDGTSWLNDWPAKGRTNYPMLFDRELQPKPAYFEVMKPLEAR